MSILAKSAPYHSCDFWATPTYCISKEHISDVELRFLKNIHGLTMKNLKKKRISSKAGFMVTVSLYLPKQIKGSLNFF